ncbi:hypothetical protein P7L87_26195, partial [Vibrio parahaemolyticus]|nr:hypothetical protein [Vibrio parahaemolyticus]
AHLATRISDVDGRLCRPKSLSGVVEPLHVFPSIQRRSCRVVYPRRVQWHLPAMLGHLLQ